MAGLITFTVLFVIGLFTWICYSISKKAEIITKDEQAKAASADVNAMQEKGERDIRDQVGVIELYLASREKTLQESRQLLEKKLDGNPENETQRTLQQIFEVYPKRTGEEVFKQTSVILAKVRDDIQYTKEKANARRADYNAVYNGPISGRVARGMEGQKKKDYFRTSEEPLLEGVLEEAKKELLTLGSDKKESELKGSSENGKEKANE